MKPFFGIDVTESKTNEKMEACRFVATSAREENIAAFERASDDTTEVFKKALLPLPFRILHGALWLLTLLCVYAFLRVAAELGFATVFHGAWWLLLAFAVLLAGAIICSVISKKKSNEVLESHEARHAFVSLDQALDLIYNDLDVPEGAVDTEILSFHFKMKNGEPVFRAKGISSAYMNLSVKIFVKDDALCFADEKHRYDIPLSALRAIHTVNKRIEIFSWDKDVEHNEEPYKQYKIREDDEGNIFIKPYHILEVALEDGLYGIYFPCYELPLFEEITSLKAKDK